MHITTMLPIDMTLAIAILHASTEIDVLLLQVLGSQGVEPPSSSSETNWH